MEDSAKAIPRNRHAGDGGSMRSMYDIDSSVISSMRVRIGPSVGRLYGDQIAVEN